MVAVVVFDVGIGVVESLLCALPAIESRSVAVLGGAGVDVEHGAGIGITGWRHYIIIYIADVFGS